MYVVDGRQTLQISDLLVIMTVVKLVTLVTVGTVVALYTLVSVRP